MPTRASRASRIAFGVMLAASCLAACTLMKPSHDDLSGGEDETPTADAAPDSSIEPDAEIEDAQPDADSSASQDVEDALGADADAHADADATPDAPDDARDEGDAPLTCEAGGKVCQNDCVAIDDPFYGCGQASCQPCALSQADAGCQSGKCSVEACNSGRSDCDDAAANGCESNLQTDPKNCGACGHACSAPLNMVSECIAGLCTTPVCAAGWSDCDADGGINGCETQTDSDPDHCGSCGNVCADGPNGVRECIAGKCGFNCIPDHGDCDGDLLNGCETLLQADLNNCGTCGNACSYAHATAQCFFGHCQQASCDALWGNCDFIDSNGCEKDLSIDKLNCGQCYKKCVGGQSCVQGICTY